MLYCKAKIMNEIAADTFFKKLGNKIDRIRIIRNHFVHSPPGAFEYPVIISRLTKPIKAEEEFREFNKIFVECLPKLDEIIKDLKNKTKC